jgi:hypothetical protein
VNRRLLHFPAVATPEKCEERVADVTYEATGTTVGRQAEASRGAGNWPVTANTTRLATDTAWSAIRS